MQLKFGLIILLLVSINSCSDEASVDCENYDYSTCIGNEPDSFDVEILLTQINDSEKIPFTIYLGKFDMYSEPPAVYLSDTAVCPLYIIRLAFGRDYSVKAEYNRPSGKVYAIDGMHLSKKEKDVCDTVCWEVEGKLLDVRLKNIE